MKRVAPHAGFMFAVSLVLIAPMLLTSRTFGPDWTNHLWLISVQGDAISNGGPSLFLHSDDLGVFYPIFAFYGGTLYAIAGALSALLGGQPLAAYIVMWLLGFLMAYGGMLWLSFQLGLSSWRAHVAPLVMLTAAYVVTNAYQRGSWPEFMAVSAMPLLLAAAIFLLRVPRVAFWPAAAFVTATIVFTGSHNITLLWGTIALAGLAFAAVLAVPSLRKVSRRQVLWVLGLGALGVAVNAWYLLPDIAYSSRTFISGPTNSLQFQAIDHFANPSSVLSPLRSRVPGLENVYPFYTELPVLVLLWAVVAAVLSAREKIAPRLLWVAAGFGAVIAVLVALLMVEFPWHHMPSALTRIQFTFRLESYIVIAIALLVAVALRTVTLWGDRRPRLTRWLEIVLAVVVVISFGQAVRQTWVDSTSKGTRADATRNIHETPPNWYAGGDFRDHAANVTGGQTPLAIDPRAVADDRATLALTPGAHVTNIGGGPYLVKIEGAHTIGRSYDGFQVIEPNPGATELKVKPSATKPVVVGRWLSILALITLLGLALGCGYRSLVVKMRKA